MKKVNPVGLKPLELDVVKHYFGELSKLSLLTREEEVECAKTLECGEEQLLSICIDSTIIVDQILNLFQEVIMGERQIYKIMKGVTKDSSSDEILKALHHLIATSDSLMSFRNSKTSEKSKKQMLQALLQLGLTYNTIKELLLIATKDLQDFRELNAEIQRKLDFLEMDDLEVYNKLAKSIKAKDVDLKHLTKEYNCSVETLYEYINSIEGLLKEKTERGFEEDAYIKVLKDLEDRVKSTEKYMQVARDALIKGNLRLVVSRAKYFLNRGLEFEDLIQEGNLGLMKAVDRFEYNRNYKFSTYATWWINQTISRALANKSKIIRVPVYMVETLNRVAKTKVKLIQKFRREPTDQEIADELEESLELIKKVSKVIKDPIRLEMPVADAGDGDNLKLQDLLIDTKSHSPYQLVAKKLMVDYTKKILATLPPRDEKILRLRFGIGESHDHTLEEVGNMYKISKERIRQIESKVIRRLKNAPTLLGKMYLEEEECE